MSDAASDGLAPVTYLPWVRPDAVATSRPVTEKRSRPDVEKTARTGRPATTGEAVDRQARPRSEAGPLPSVEATTADPATVDPPETGVERDDRIDRLVVSRLRRSALSVTEVRSVLAEHGLDEHEIDEWIERYERLGYLDDARLAEQLVHSHGVRRGRGSGAILNELSRRGIDGGIARAAVEDLDPETERENALAVAERRARQLTGLDRQTAERRLSAFLQRRGYSSDIVREAVTAAIAAAGS
ncbi:regulatory protein RecX [Agromyces humatus]|uniref:Regulatory protein RecX n=1 Tax=Agromyces humatus TaxID=279573 RepID=A0ABN2K3N8_9MICO|nr:regulatory protein RecX [Agromyces humatus]